MRGKRRPLDRLSLLVSSFNLWIGVQLSERLAIYSPSTKRAHPPRIIMPPDAREAMCR
jgi:hypothetical protein